MSVFALSCLLTGCISLAVGLFVTLNNPTARTNRLWGLVSASVAIWSIGLGFLTGATDNQGATRWLHVHYVGAILIPVFFLHFVQVLVNKGQALILYGGYVLSGVFLFLNFTGRLADVVPKAQFSFYTAPLAAYPAYVIFFFTTVLYAHILLLREYYVSSGQKREQLKYLFFGSTVGFIGGSTAFFPVFDWPIFPYGIYLVALYVLIIGYSIIRHRLMDIAVVIHKGVAYGFLLAAIFIPTYLAVAASERATLYSLPPLLAGTLIVACGLWVLMKKPDSLVNITFNLVWAPSGSGCSASSWSIPRPMKRRRISGPGACMWASCTSLPRSITLPAAFCNTGCPTS